ncbi:hypothetical protein ACHAQA_005375 [Verticillium albo-atrum]
MGSLPDQASNSSSRFSSLQVSIIEGPFVVELAYRKDPSPLKVNLGVGAYRDDDGQPWPLPVVKEARKRIAAGDWHHEYLNPRGNDQLLEGSKRVIFGPDIDAQLGASIANIQTIAGTGANSLIARFVGRHLQPANIWLPDPTWTNHFKIWSENAPGVQQRLYPYYDAASRAFDFDGAVAALRSGAAPGDAVLLHACAHNPTGLDPSRAQWARIADLCEEKGLFVIFDIAYQGFASGDLDHDAWAVRHFAARPRLEVAVCQSFSKNLGLYGERVGVLHIVPARAAGAVTAAAVQSQLVGMQRADISMGPRFGSEVAALILSDPGLYALWQEDLAVISGRIETMRQALYDELVRLGTPGDWRHIVEQKGMFSYTGLDAEDAAALQSQYHIYLLPSGRVSICGLRSGNVKYVAGAIHEVVLGKTKKSQT